MAEKNYFDNMELSELSELFPVGTIVTKQTLDGTVWKGRVTNDFSQPKFGAPVPRSTYEAAFISGAAHAKNFIAVKVLEKTFKGDRHLINSPISYVGWSPIKITIVDEDEEFLDYNHRQLFNDLYCDLEQVGYNCELREDRIIINMDSGPYEFVLVPKY